MIASKRRTAGAAFVHVLALLAFVLFPIRPAGALAACAPPAAPDPMPEADGHDHLDPSQHRFACGLLQVAFTDLEDLVPEPVNFGELDVAGGIVVMAIAYPDAGFVVFDASDPVNPIALARFRGPRCETVVIDVDCGADVKLTPDGRTAFLATQTPRVPPGEPPGTTTLPEVPGIMTVDLSSPGSPKLVATTPVPPRGSHMIAYHRIGGRPYVFAIRNGVGYQVFRVDGAGGGTRLVSVAEVSTHSVHDLSLFTDPADGKTYLFFSGAGEGLFVYDVTNPARPRPVGSWKPAPERQGEQWYVHGAWTFRDGARRLTFVGPEVFEPGGWHGGVAGPIWLLDTTDPAAPRVIGTWRNPGRHPAGNLEFSPHSFWFSNGLMYLAHYHGGVWLLDWRPVIAGDAGRPDEIGYHVPHDSRRPVLRVTPRHRFLSALTFDTRPLVWDVVSDGTHAYVSDINGGLSVLARSVGARQAPPAHRFPGAAVGAGTAALLIALLGIRRATGRRRRGAR